MSYLSDVPVTEEEVERIKSTIGSLYKVNCQTVVFEDKGRDLIKSRLSGEDVEAGDLVVLLEYNQVRIPYWTTDEKRTEKFYERDIPVRVLTTKGFIGTIYFDCLEPL